MCPSKTKSLLLCAIYDVAILLLLDSSLMDKNEFKQLLELKKQIDSKPSFITQRLMYNAMHQECLRLRQ